MPDLENNSQNFNQADQSSNQVYVMPEKYYSGANGGWQKALFLAILIAVLVLVSVGVYFAWGWWQNKDSQSQTANIQTEQPALVQFDNQLNIAEDDLDLDLATTTATTNDDLFNDDQSDFTQLIDDVQPIAPLDISSDTDRDGLTDLEEMLFGTSPSRPDSDEDGYADAREVANGYDPALPGDAKLADSSATQYVETDFVSNNFRFMSMSEWQVGFNEKDKQAFVYTDTDEIIRVSIKPNIEGISATNWYLQSYLNTSLSQLRSADINGLIGVYSPNRLKVYLTDEARENFYIFEYIVSDINDQMRYPNIFDMIINTFELMPDRVEIDNIDNGTSTDFLLDSGVTTSTTSIDNESISQE